MKTTNDIINEMTKEERISFRAKTNEIYNQMFSSEVYQTKNLEYCQERAIIALGLGE